MHKRLRILLVQPDFHRYYVPFLPNYEPLVMILLASLVKDIADSLIIDRRFESERSLIRAIKEFKPDIVATRTHTSGEVFTTKRILQVAKLYAPGCTTIIGGQHPTLMPDDLNAPNIDLICIGAGEDTFREVVMAKADNRSFDSICGLAIRKDGELLFTTPRIAHSGTFSWPVLQRDLAAKYRRHFIHGFTITSTGCPHRCSFCALWVAAGGTYRLRDVDNVIEDIASISHRFIYIGDDNTFHDSKHAMDICEGLRKRSVKKQFGAYARTDTIVEHRKVFEEWAKIGLKTLVVGMEVVTEKALQDINKRNSLENNIKANEILNELGIHNYAHFIVFPEFMPRDFDDIWSFVKKHKIANGFFVPLTPYAGTPMFKSAKEKKIFSIYNYGFYNLEYMICKTKLPKWLFYHHFMKLWLKSLSPLTFLTFRINYPLSAYIFRLKMMGGAILKGYVIKILIQIVTEKIQDKKDIEARLLPSQREGYKFRYLNDGES